MENERGSIGLVAVIIIVLVVIGALGYVAYNQFLKPSTNTAKTTTSSVQVKHPGVSTSVVFAPDIDSAGAPVNSSTNFTVSTPKIYMVVSLTAANVSQRVEFTRYLNGKFVDNGSITLKDGAKYASFLFTLQVGKARPIGTYVVKVYTNGIYERSATYFIN